MRELETNNYLPKRVLFALVGEKLFGKIKLFKHILDYRLGLPFEISPLYKHFLSCDSIAIDIGANYGQNACRLNGIIDNGFVVATRSTLLNIEGIKHRTEKVMATTIDEFVMKKGIAKVDFIKYDTEGNEPNVLEGGKNTIMKFFPVLSFEMSYKNSHINWLVDFGYKLFYHDTAIHKLRIINQFPTRSIRVPTCSG